jgi:predicted glycoside hydrolase/deacetylase ChbG (UPF0249 family)
MTGHGGRRVVIHADDLGMCHGANAAFVELSELGIVSAGSVMVPCPWFLEMAELAAADTRLDLGVHLTLTSEKRHYKWRPLTAPSAAAGLTDANGFFHPDVATLRAQAAPEAVEAELHAQIEAALAAGIDVTHLDDHMGAVLAPEFCDIYIHLGLEYRLPILLTPSLSAYGPIHNIASVRDEPYRASVAKARAAAFVIFDCVIETPWDRTGPAEPAYRAMFETLGPGLTFIALHFTAPGELQFIEPDTGHLRVEEYVLFRDPAFRAFVANAGIEIVGMCALRDQLRADLAAAGQRVASAGRLTRAN